MPLITPPAWGQNWNVGGQVSDFAREFQQAYNAEKERQRQKDLDAQKIELEKAQAYKAAQQADAYSKHMAALTDSQQMQSAETARQLAESDAVRKGVPLLAHLLAPGGEYTKPGAAPVEGTSQLAGPPSDETPTTQDVPQATLPGVAQAGVTQESAPVTSYAMRALQEQARKRAEDAAKLQADAIAKGTLVQDENGNYVSSALISAREAAKQRAEAAKQASDDKRFIANQAHLDRQAALQSKAGNPDDFEQIVKQYMGGDITMADLGRAGGDMKARVLAEVGRRDPKFTSATYSARKKMRDDYSASGPGTAGGQLDSLNQLAGHLGLLQDASKALQNHDLQLMNQITNKASEAFGSDKVTNFQTAQLAVAEEIARLLKGGVAGEKEGEAWLNRVKAANSPEQLNGAIGEIRSLVRSRLQSKRQRWNAVMGKEHSDEFNNFLMPEAVDMFGGTSNAPAGAAAPQPKPGNPLGLPGF